MSMRVSARLQQREAAAKGASDTRSEDGSASKGVGAKDIQLVQTLIERCLQLYMPLKDVVSTLQAQAKIEPGFTNLVWQKLEEQNHEFFEAYYLRLKLKEHVVMFNHLVEQQMAMTQKLHTSWMQAMPALMARPPSFVPGGQSMPMQPGSMPSFPAPGGTQPAAPSAPNPQHDLMPEQAHGTPGAGTMLNTTATDGPLRHGGHALPGGGTNGFTLPLSPLDPASLTGLDDLLLMGGPAQPQPPTPPQAGEEEEEEEGLRLLTDGPTMGTGRGAGAGDLSCNDDLIDGLMPGWGRPGAGQEDNLMLDGAPAALGSHMKNFSMSDLKGWAFDQEHQGGREASEGGDHHVGGGLTGDVPGGSGGHDSSSPDEHQGLGQSGGQLGVNGGDDGDGGLGGDGGMDGGVLDGGEPDEVTAAFQRINNSNMWY